MSDAENNNKGIAKIRELISSFEYEKISCKELIFLYVIAVRYLRLNLMKVNIFSFLSSIFLSSRF